MKCMRLDIQSLILEKDMRRALTSHEHYHSNFPSCVWSVSDMISVYIMTFFSILERTCLIAFISPKSTMVLMLLKLRKILALLICSPLQRTTRISTMKVSALLSPEHISHGSLVCGDHHRACMGSCTSIIFIFLFHLSVSQRTFISFIWSCW